MILIDEAYIHLCDAPRSIDFVKEGKNVIVLRTFSKLYGMAGIRMGFAVGRPDLLAKITQFGGMNALPITAVAGGQGQPARCGSRSDPQEDHRRYPHANTGMAQERGLQQALLPRATASCSTCASPARKCRRHLAAKEMYVGRIWPAWPNSVRITVGTPDEMMAFRKDFTEVMSGSTAGLAPPQMPRRLAKAPFTHLS